MRLLLFTQAVDTNDPVLGFFHGWLLEFSKHFKEINVICLFEGEHALPENVHVHSLGKEGGVSVIKYVTRFYRYLFLLRNSYDSVFVHMNPHYVVLGGTWWKVVGKPVLFWRNHARMNLKTRIAAFFARRVFYTSPFACMSRYAHSVQMPVGIDLARFQMREVAREGKIKVLLLGRLSPVKRSEIFVEAGAFLGDAYEFHVYGDDTSDAKKYGAKLKQIAGKNVFFHPAVKNDETPDIYRAHNIYVNLTPEGSMDKTVLEAVACGTFVIVTNTSFSKVVSPHSILIEATPNALAKKIQEVEGLSFEEKKRYRVEAYEAVARDHSLEKLAELLHGYSQEAVRQVSKNN